MLKKVAVVPPTYQKVVAAMIQQKEFVVVVVVAVIVVVPTHSLSTLAGGSIVRRARHTQGVRDGFRKRVSIFSYSDFFMRLPVFKIPLILSFSRRSMFLNFRFAFTGIRT